MSYTRSTQALTEAAVLALLAAGVEKARTMGQPQCIVVVDASGVDLGSIRMDGARFLSMRSARAKATTAASTGNPSGAIAESARMLLAAATDGAVTGLPGGLPIRMDGLLLGGIGVGSGTGAQDVEVAAAALAAIGADPA